jgi:hypothetical protein
MKVGCISCEDWKSLNVKVVGYEENIHPKTNRGDVLVIEGVYVDFESLNYVKPLTLEEILQDMDKTFI